MKTLLWDVYVPFVQKRRRWLIAIAILVTLGYFAPSVLVSLASAGWSVTCSLFGAGSSVVKSAYGTGHEMATGRPPPSTISHGREMEVTVNVTFDVNPRYRGWGQLLRSPHQLPEVTGRVYAARIVNGRVESLLPSETSLLAQRRLNWSSATRMEWTRVHARVGERSTHLCVELTEATEGWNFLGTIDDALHLIHWDDAHLTSGDSPVASGSCVELRHGLRIDATGRHPHVALYDFPATRMHRAGESDHTGTLSVIWAGPNG